MICTICGKLFNPRNNIQSRCSAKCNVTYHNYIRSGRVSYYTQCVHCGEYFITSRNTSKYCSSVCKSRELIARFYREHLGYRLSHSIKTRIVKIVKNPHKDEHLKDILGYSGTDLVNHIEKGFTGGMSWDNYGLWHIDHKIPVSAFNIKEWGDYDLKRCWALDNLQPMWASDNFRKGAKLEKPFQPALI